MARISSTRQSCSSDQASSFPLTGIPHRGGGKNARTDRIVNLCLILVALMVAGSFESTTRAQTIYWTETTGAHEGVRRVLVSGLNVQNLVTTLEPLGIALDADAGKMYWTKSAGFDDRIQRANLDGSRIEDLVTTGLHVPMGIAVDATGGKVYWTDPNPNANSIRRANLRGSSVEDLITGLDEPIAIDLDTVAGKMYWATSSGGMIQRANLDGSLVENVLTSLGSGFDRPWGIALDVAGGKVYWTQRGFTVAGQIRRANLDGSGIEDLVTIAGSDPTAIALDVAAGKMYWTDHALNELARADLDGSNVETILADEPSRPTGIAIQFSECGDGVAEGAEVCDDGGESTTCDADCTFAECGDGTLNTAAGEECDDGLNNSDTEPNACRTDCSQARCGDGVVDTGEECDDGMNNSNTEPDACRTDCSQVRCGDRVVDTGEECDDGNTEPDDGCAGDCLFEQGACCLDTACRITTEFDCLDSDGAFVGFNTTCDAPDADGDGLPDECDNCPGVDDAVFGDCTGTIPTVSVWGLLILALLLLAGSKVVFRHRLRRYPFS